MASFSGAFFPAGKKVRRGCSAGIVNDAASFWDAMYRPGEGLD